MISFKVKESCCAAELSTISVKIDSAVNCCSVPVCICDNETAVKSPNESGLCPVSCVGGHICTSKRGPCVGDNVLTVHTESADCLEKVEVVVEQLEVMQKNLFWWAPPHLQHFYPLITVASPPPTFRSTHAAIRLAGRVLHSRSVSERRARQFGRQW